MSRISTKPAKKKKISSRDLLQLSSHYILLWWSCLVCVCSKFLKNRIEWDLIRLRCKATKMNDDVRGWCTRSDQTSFHVLPKKFNTNYVTCLVTVVLVVLLVYLLDFRQEKESFKVTHYQVEHYCVPFHFFFQVICA